MSELGVPSLLFTDPTALTGIYILEFGNGFRYVGKTVNIISRSATHVRRHGDVVAINFAPCSKVDLDFFERQTIRAQEATFDLRNKLLTSLPGGKDTIEIEVREGVSAALPWLRSVRRRAEPVLGKAGRSPKLSRLRQRDDYEQLTQALAVYIDETIPDPNRTAGVLWSISVLPRTSGGRVVTLNCGGLEAMWAADDVENGKPVVTVSLNLASSNEIGDENEEEDSDESETFGIVDVAEVQYGQALVTTVRLESWSAFEHLIREPTIAEAAYRLNTQMMRQGKNRYRRFHDGPFGQILLDRASRRGLQ
ncbi:hypothetical protein B7R23_04030 [Subtercola boreus]|nr:hypothetical protein B7R24_04035 [Subtercola boreus]RFA23134.1 hypothetical protein B7R23_04030 [Subtercola boreus]